MAESTLNAAIRQFEAVEANLVKLEKALGDVMARIPTGIVFGEDPDYERACWTFMELLGSVPAIDGWMPDIHLMDLNQIAQNRFDANELGEVELFVSLQEDIDKPAKGLREYRYLFDKKRRELVRDAIVEMIDAIDEDLRRLAEELSSTKAVNDKVESAVLAELREHVAQVSALLGSSTSPPLRWSDMIRHLHFGQHGDIRDVMVLDWPSVKSGLRKSLYGEMEPVPVQVNDLSDLVNAKPTGSVATSLQWGRLDDEDFERLIFALISSEKGYENPQWLTRTNAPDRGRDLSVERILIDPLAGTTRHRVIIQCKHWLTKSVAPTEVALLKEQMHLHEPPRVDICVIATSGRFTSDAIRLVETNNGSDTGLRMEMWPESHLELLLASRPWLIAEFGLR